MYEKCKDGDISLWCDADVSETSGLEKRKRKRDGDSGTTRRSEEEDVDAIFRELKEKHGNNYSVPQLRLWARMLHCNTHDSQESPPAVPMFSDNCVAKRPKRESLSEFISEAVVAVRKALEPKGTPDDSGPSGTSGHSAATDSSIGYSPTKSADLRMKHFSSCVIYSSCLKIKFCLTLNFQSRKK